jgi:predicted MPP superfamily phosphohydrolase
MDQQQTVQDAPPAEQPAEPPPGPRYRGPWIQWRDPGRFEWNRYELPIAALPPQLEGLRIAHISDLHVRGSWRRGYDELIERVRSEAPDLILITGDYVDYKRRQDPAVPHVRRILEGLSAPLGCFGTLGNHDRHKLASKLEGTGLTLLDGARRLLEVEGAALELIGLPGVDRRELTPQMLESFPRRETGVPRIVMCHFPDGLRKAAALHPDIYLAGHTHGGQICLPGGWPPVRHSPLPRTLCKGVHRAANTWLVVGRGMGFTNIQLRLFCPTEVIELILTRG